ASFVPPDPASHGRPAAAAAPPIGIAVWRTPRASPRSSAGNQPMTARPLAAFTLAPNAPAAASASTSAPYECVQPAARIDAAAAVAGDGGGASAEARRSALGSGVAGFAGDGAGDSA